MKIGILGTGVAGRTIARKLSRLGHSVTVGTRDIDKALSSTETNRAGVSFGE